MKVILLLLFISLSEQATYYVQPGGTGSGGSGDPFGTIQSAVNTATSGDLIILKAGVYQGTGNRGITFSGKQIAIVSESGWRNTIITCNSTANRAFLISNAADIVTIDGVQITACARSAVSVSAASSNVTLRNCYINGNTAASNGGGVSITTSASVYLYDTVFHQNSLSAIYCSLGTVSIVRCRFSENTGVSSNGGGVYGSTTPTILIRSSIFISNQMAIFVSDGTLTLTNNKFFNNTSSYTIQYSDLVTLTKSGNSFCGPNGNSITPANWTEYISPHDGCFVCNGNNEDKDCNGVCWGAGDNCISAQTIHVYTNQTIQDAIDSVNSYKAVITIHPGTYSGTGNRDIDVGGKAVILRGSTGDPYDVVIDCGGTSGMSGFILDSHESYDTTIESLTIKRCPDSGIRVGAQSGVTINDCTITGCFKSRGGGVYILDGQAIINGTSVTNCTAISGAGVAVETSDAIAYLSVRNSMFSYNVASSDGGAIWANEAILEVSNSYFIENTAGSSYRGGAIYSAMNPGDDLVISGSSFYNNGYSQTASTQETVYCSSGNFSLNGFNVYNSNSFCGADYSKNITCGNWTASLVSAGDCNVCDGSNQKDCGGVCFGQGVSDGYGGCCPETTRDCASHCNSQFEYAPNATNTSICCFVPYIDECGVCNGTNSTCCSSGCYNGICNAPYCNCTAGWTGIDCSVVDEGYDYFVNLTGTMKSTVNGLNDTSAVYHLYYTVRYPNISILIKCGITTGWCGFGFSESGLMSAVGTKTDAVIGARDANTASDNIGDFTIAGNRNPGFCGTQSAVCLDSDTSNCTNSIYNTSITIDSSYTYIKWERPLQASDPCDMEILLGQPMNIIYAWSTANVATWPTGMATHTRHSYPMQITITAPFTSTTSPITSGALSTGAISTGAITTGAVTSGSVTSGLITTGLLTSSDPLLSRMYDYSVDLLITTSDFFKFFWTVDIPNNLVYMGLICKQPVRFNGTTTEDGGWCGVGISEFGQMIGSDAIIGSFDSNGTMGIMDYLMNQRFSPSDGSCPNAVCIDDYPGRSCFQSISNLAGQNNGSFMAFEFARPINASDACDLDIPINDPSQTLIYARGFGAVPNTIQRHVARGVYVMDWQPYAVTTGFLTTSELTSGAIVTSSPLTTSPLSTGSISTGAITSGSVTSAPITSGVHFTTSPLTSGPITSSPLTTSQVTSGSFTSGHVTSNEITSGIVLESDSEGISLSQTMIYISITVPIGIILFTTSALFIYIQSRRAKGMDIIPLRDMKKYNRLD